ncbi:MAG: hypothetical protein NUV98_07500 [Candidatus Roizmanbacteria bacterium]|nr:hypothetical protein [Candidatus Roizmanbacteria bacterium]
MLNLNSVMIGTSQVKVLAEFYEKVFGKAPDMQEGEWYGWSVGNTFISFGTHSEVKGKAKEPQRMIFNLETKEVKEEFERIKKLGATVIKEPYEMSSEAGSGSDGQGAWIATLADPDGNYFQLMTPWKG